MSYGRLAISEPLANTDTIVYTVPENCKYADININILNPDVNDASIELAIATTDTPAIGEYVEKGSIVPANGGILERTSTICSPGERIIIKSSLASSIVRISGKLIIH